VRWIGALAIVLSSALLGHLAARERERKVRDLESLLVGLNLLETEIVYGLTVLPVAMERAARGAPGAAALFGTAANVLRQGRGIEEAWRAGVRALESRSALGPEDLSAVAHLAGSLGLSSASDQSRHLGLARRKVETRLAAEQGRLPEAARLARALGLCGGLAAAVLLV